PCFTPDSRWLLTVTDARGQPGSLWEWQVRDAETGKVVTQLKDLGTLTVSPDGRRVCSNNGRGQARLWDPATGQPGSPVLTYGDPKQRYNFLTSFSADSRRLAILYGRSKPGGVVDNATQRWDAVTGQPLGPPQQLPAGLGSQVLSFDMRHVLVAAKDGTPRPIDAGTGPPIGEP